VGSQADAWDINRLWCPDSFCGSEQWLHVLLMLLQVGLPRVQCRPHLDPLINTLPTPEYVSGHQATVGAMLEVLLKTLGGKERGVQSLPACLKCHMI